MNENKRPLDKYLEIGHTYVVYRLGEKATTFTLLDMNDQLMLLEPTHYTNNPVAIVVPYASILRMERQS